LSLHAAMMLRHVSSRAKGHAGDAHSFAAGAASAAGSSAATPRGAPLISRCRREVPRYRFCLMRRCHYSAPAAFARRDKMPPPPPIAEMLTLFHTSAESRPRDADAATRFSPLLIAFAALIVFQS